MKRPYKKRIKLRGDGFYYPQYRWFGLWLDYDLADTTGRTSTSYRYASESGARQFLQQREDIELHRSELSKNTRIIKWNSAQ